MNIEARQLLAEVKNTDQDFEWYPTTDQIIGVIKRDISILKGPELISMLDVGAGDGRVLQALGGDKKYAIEKSRPLLDAMPADIFIVGTEFSEQTLIDKKVDCVFCNPPYSEYEKWSERIIREANAGMIYLVIPDRWSKSKKILQAIESREAETQVLGAFGFLNADRKARCNVNIVKINLGGWSSSYRFGIPTVDPFELWFKENFVIGAQTDSCEFNSSEKDNLKDTLAGELVEGGDVAVVLVRLYQDESIKLMDTYKKLESIDSDLLKEMDINLQGVRESLKLKYEGLKDCYWRELFDNLKKVTSKLSNYSRKIMLDTLTSHTHVDFSLENIYGILGWVCKNANVYFDTQLVRLVEQITASANVVLYKSNRRTFGKDKWRYNAIPDGLTCYALDYRIILSGWYGLESNKYSSTYNCCGLSKSGADILNDLRTIAGNLGFESVGKTVHDFVWDLDNKKHEFICKNNRTGEIDLLFTATAYKNGNMHLQLNQDFIMRLNVEFGRLKGWVKAPSDAVKEMAIPADVAAQAFQSNNQLSSILKLTMEQ